MSSRRIRSCRSTTLNVPVSWTSCRYSCLGHPHQRQGAYCTPITCSGSPNLTLGHILPSTIGDMNLDFEPYKRFPVRRRSGCSGPDFGGLPGPWRWQMHDNDMYRPLLCQSDQLAHTNLYCFRCCCYSAFLLYLSQLHHFHIASRMKSNERLRSCCHVDTAFLIFIRSTVTVFHFIP